MTQRTRGTRGRTTHVVRPGRQCIWTHRRNITSPMGTYIADAGSWKVYCPHSLAVMASAFVMLALIVSTAHASYVNVGEFGKGESLNDIAVNDSSGEVYIPDFRTSKVARFDEKGTFLGQWGWNVIATGPDKAGIDQKVEITIEATAGEYELEYSGEHTVPLTINPLESEQEASAKVEKALNELKTIQENAATGERELGGFVKVTGGPGDSTGSKPFVVTFAGTDGGEPEGSIGVVNSTTGGVTKDRTTVRGAPAFEDCVVASGDVCRIRGTSGVGIGEFETANTVAVDNSCALHVPALIEPTCKAFDPYDGDVFVLEFSAGRTTGAVQVFSPEGRYVTSFGERTEETTIKTSPEKMHGVGQHGNSIAIDTAGNVYVVDINRGDDEEDRVMVFKSNAGVYRYASEIPVGKSVGVGLPKSPGAAAVTVDASGDVYVTNLEETYLYRFTPLDLTTLAWESAYTCRSAPYRELDGLTVDPLTSEVFAYSDTDAGFYRLSSTCVQLGPLEKGVEIGGKSEAQTVGLAFNPFLSFESGAPAGTLYAVNNDPSVAPVDTALIFSQPPEFRPEVESEAVSAVGSGSATLEARVSPRGYETTYLFEYGLEGCETSKCAQAPISGAVAGSGATGVTVAESVTGLTPDATYHYRVVATNRFGTVDGAEKTFNTYPTNVSNLSDGRAYELVSPPTTEGGEVFSPFPEAGDQCECKPGISSRPMPMQSGPTGDTVVYEGEPFAPTGEAAHENEYFAERSADGWVTHDLSPELEGNEAGYEAFSMDLSAGVLVQTGPSLAPGGLTGFADLYRTDTYEGAGALTPLLTEAPPDRTSAKGSFKLTFAGASEDFSDLIFEANDALTGPESPNAPAAADGGELEDNLYEWMDGKLLLVNVLPGNKVTESGATFGSIGAKEVPDFDRIISADGSQIYWSGKGGQVFARIDGKTTVEVPDHSAGYLTASVDGAKVMLNDGTIYQLNGAQTEFTPMVDLTSGQKGFLGILGTSSDLTHVYFVATTVLAENENENKEKAEKGATNLYAWHDGTVAFIGKLVGGDEGDNETFGGANPGGDWSSSSTDRTAQVTSDGTYLAFMSKASLTGYQSGGRYEVFEYGEATGRLICASCNPSNAAALGPYGASLSVFAPTKRMYLDQPNNLVDNGRLFFDSYDSLSPHDVNHGVEDVYEYEPGGAGACEREAGCISLITSGHGTSDSNFVAADPTGKNVFFASRENLVPEAQGGLYKLYDARVNGGFQKIAPPACTGAGCQGVPNQPPIFAAPSSVTFNGVGNFPPPSPPIKCPNGKKLVHGKCVKHKVKKKSKKKRRRHSGRGRR